VLTPESATVGPAATTGSFTMSAGCNWSVNPRTSWLTVTSSGSGVGDGTISYSVAANTGAQRVGTIDVADQTFTLTQAAASGGSGCTYSISPTSRNFTSSGGTGSVTVTTGASCPWSATSNNFWLTVTNGTNRTGGGTVSYTVSSRTSTTLRTGTITIAGQTFTVYQQQ
jgi:hypothetical protein